MDDETQAMLAARVWTAAALLLLVVAVRAVSESGARDGAQPPRMLPSSWSAGILRPFRSTVPAA